MGIVLAVWRVVVDVAKFWQKVHPISPIIVLFLFIPMASHPADW